MAAAAMRLPHPAAAAAAAAVAVAVVTVVAQRLWEVAAVPAATTALERASRAFFSLRASLAQSRT